MLQFLLCYDTRSVFSTVLNKCVDESFYTSVCYNDDFKLWDPFFINYMHFLWLQVLSLS